MWDMRIRLMANVVLTSTRTKRFTDKDIDETVMKAIDLLKLEFHSKIEKVIIKPNLCYYWDYSTGETTDPRVVSAVIDHIRTRFNRDACIFVSEADASAMKTKYAFKMLGYEKLAREKDVELLNLSEGDIVEKHVEVRDNEFALKVNRVLMESDLVVNVPKLKSHRVAGITCCLKNMFGAIAKPRKYVYHPMLSDVIVGINKIVKSDVCLVDGIRARGSHPKKMGVLIAGDDALATDFVAAKILGLSRNGIEHLRLAAEEKIGDANPINLVEDEVTLGEVERFFPRQSYFLQRLSWGIQLRLLKFYSRIVGDVIPPVLEE